MHILLELLLLSEFKETVISLQIQKRQFSDRKQIWRTMESKLEGTVNYLQFFEWTFDAAKYIDWLFLVYVQVVPIHNNGDPKRPKEISKAVGEYACAHSQLPPSRWLRACWSKDSRKMKAIGKTAEAARESVEGLPI